MPQLIKFNQKPNLTQIQLTKVNEKPNLTHTHLTKFKLQNQKSNTHPDDKFNKESQVNLKQRRKRLTL